MSILKKSLVFVAAVAGLANAWAFDGSVTVNGTVTSTTCTVTVMNDAGAAPGTNSLTINLPIISASALKGVGTTAGSMFFAIQITNCNNSGAHTNWTTYFEGGDINKFDRISDHSGQASFDVEIVNEDGTPLYLSGGPTDQGVPVKAMPPGPAANYLGFRARYYATSATTTPGTFSGTFNYTIVYL